MPSGGCTTHIKTLTHTLSTPSPPLLPEGALVFSPITFLQQPTGGYNQKWIDIACQTRVEKMETHLRVRKVSSRLNVLVDLANSLMMLVCMLCVNKKDHCLMLVLKPC